MLVDLVNEWPESDYCQMFGQPNVKAYKSLANKIRMAPRFDLQRDAVFLIEDLSRTVMPSRIIDSLSLCRLPFPKMWIEFVHKDRNDWVVIAANDGRFIQQDWDDAEMHKPQRIGIFLEDISDGGPNRIEATMVWNFHGIDILNFCSQSMIIDLEPREPEVIDPSLISNSSNRGQNTWAKSWQGNLKEESAAYDLEQRITLQTPDHIQPAMEYAFSTGGREAVDVLLRSAIYDLSGEWKFILSIIMVLNSKNVLEYGSETTYDKLNKQRVKKGKPPLLSHRPVTLHLSRAQHARMGTVDARGGQTKDIRPHLVRGHWKLRKTGLFFWSTHSRHDDNEGPAPVYRVKA